MKIKFDERAAEALLPLCFIRAGGDVQAAMQDLGFRIIARANKETGASYAQIAGRKIDLQIIERWEEGELVALICLRERVWEQ